MNKKNIQELAVTGGVVFTGITAKTAHYVYNYEPETKIVERKKEDIIETDFDLDAIKITGEAINQPTADLYVPPLTNFISGNEIIQPEKIKKNNFDIDYLDGTEVITFAQPKSMIWDGTPITHKEFNEKINEIEGSTPIVTDEYTQDPEIKGQSNNLNILEEEDSINPIVLDTNSIQFAIAEDKALERFNIEAETIQPYMQPTSIEGENLVEYITESNLQEINYSSVPITIENVDKEAKIYKLYYELINNKYTVDIIDSIPETVTDWKITDIKHIAKARFKEKAPLQINFGTDTDQVMLRWQIKNKDGQMTDNEFTTMKNYIENLFKNYQVIEAK